MMGHGDMGLMWPWMLSWSVIALAVLLALIWAIIRLVQTGTRDPDSGSARRILDERYARGEIGDEEYRTRRDTLRQIKTP